MPLTDLGVMELRDSVHNVPLAIYEREREVQDIRPLDILIVKDGTYRIDEPVILLEDDLNNEMREILEQRKIDQHKLEKI